MKYLIASHIKRAFIKYGWHSTISRSENLVYILKVNKNRNKTYKFGLNEFPANVVISYSYHVLKIMLFHNRRVFVLSNKFNRFIYMIKIRFKLMLKNSVSIISKNFWFSLYITWSQLGNWKEYAYLYLCFFH